MDITIQNTITYVILKKRVHMNNKILDLINKINFEANKIANEPPEVIIDIFQRGIIKNKSGTRGQYFSTLIFIQGVCRSLAYDCVNNFMYLLDEENFTKDHLITILPRYFRANANFLGYCGLDHVWDFTSAPCRSCPSMASASPTRRTCRSCRAASSRTWNSPTACW